MEKFALRLPVAVIYDSRRVPSRGSSFFGTKLIQSALPLHSPRNPVVYGSREGGVGLVQRMKLWGNADSSFVGVLVAQAIDEELVRRRRAVVKIEPELMVVLDAASSLTISGCTSNVVWITSCRTTSCSSPRLKIGFE